MRWEEVKERFQNEWVVLEATKAHSKNGNRYIEEVVVVDRFDDSTSAMRRYSELHKQEPSLKRMLLEQLGLFLNQKILWIPSKVLVVSSTFTR